LAQLLPVQRQTPFAEPVLQVAMQHWILSAPGQYPATYAPPVQALDVLSQKPEPNGVLHVRTQHWILSAPGQ
jgi:hypothetical protein